MELCSILRVAWMWKGVWGRTHAHTHMLLMGYTPIQNEKLKIKWIRKKKVLGLFFHSQSLVDNTISVANLTLTLSPNPNPKHNILKELLLCAVSTYKQQNIKQHNWKTTSQTSFFKSNVKNMTSITTFVSKYLRQWWQQATWTKRENLFFLKDHNK